MFSERQYHAVLKSPDALRWKLYVDRKKNEIEFRSKEITRTQSTSIKHKLQHEQSRAQKLLQEDSELFKKHNELRESLLKQAIEMHSRCLETSNNFDEDSAIRFCSLWFANFDDTSTLDAVSSALDRIPSRKLVPLAVRFLIMPSFLFFKFLSAPNHSSPPGLINWRIGADSRNSAKTCNENVPGAPFPHLIPSLLHIRSSAFTRPKTIWTFFPIDSNGTRGCCNEHPGTHAS